MEKREKGVKNWVLFNYSLGRTSMFSREFYLFRFEVFALIKSRFQRWNEGFFIGKILAKSPILLTKVESQRQNEGLRFEVSCQVLTQIWWF